LILLDASGLFAALDRAEPMHTAARAALEREAGPLLLSPFALCELDYLIGRELGVGAELDFLEQVAAGVYELVSFGGQDVYETTNVIATYRELAVGLADASIVVLAGRYGTNRVLTLDERHFRALRTPGGDPFVVLPADA
jgi:predicted nucleic acid-binding protein